MTTIELFERLGLALAIGLLMGAERGWAARDQPEGLRVAGILTFALIGLTGGVWGVLAGQLGPMVLAAAFLAFAALVVAGHASRLKLGSDVGITTEVAEFATFALGTLAAIGDMRVAAAGGVVATALLNSKQVLHAWLQRLDRLEMRAAIRLLLISVVMLPVLPNQGYGPEGVLNPYLVWLLVVLVAAISFVGYFAIKLAGPRIGSLLTGLFGGLASSTALTLSFARMGRAGPAMQPLLAAGVAIANATMYGRLWVIVLLLNRRVAVQLLPPLAAMLAAGVIAALLLWRGRSEDGKSGDGKLGATKLSNPFELGTAVKFALLLSAVVVASRLAQAWVGDAGLYLLAAVAGLADVDAISLSMAQMGGHGVTVTVAATAILIAAFVNTAVKAVLVAGLCGGVMARRTAAAMAAMIAAGGLGMVLTIG